MPAISITTTESLRRPSGARLYHRHSRFGGPEKRKLDRNLVARIIHCAECLDRRTRTKHQHGGVLKHHGLAVLRALLRHFYSYRTGECFPSYEMIAEAAGVSRSTVRTKLRVLEDLGLIETIRRKVVATFRSQLHRVAFDCAIQTSNSYVLNFPFVDRPVHGDLGLPLFREPEVKNWPETSYRDKNHLPPELVAALDGLKLAIDGNV